MIKPSIQLYLTLLSAKRDIEDVTIVLNTEEMQELVAHIDTSTYKETFIFNKGSYHFVHSSKDALYIEGIMSEISNNVKVHSTDSLYVPRYIPDDIAERLISECEYLNYMFL